MARAVDIVLDYIDLAQRARRDQTDQAWDAVSAYWDEGVEVRVADGRTGRQVWRVTARDRAEARARLSRSEVSASRLSTTTVRAFQSEDGRVVVVEQISELAADGPDAVRIPTCHVFEIEDDRIVRHSVYRNEA